MHTILKDGNKWEVVTVVNGVMIVSYKYTFDARKTADEFSARLRATEMAAYLNGGERPKDVGMLVEMGSQ